MPDHQVKQPQPQAALSRKAVIINGDDFGMSPEVNAGIIRAHSEGVLRSASLMVAGDAWKEAIEAAHEFPLLDVGLHLVVCKGRSVLGPSRIAPLVDGSGMFGDHPVLGGLRYFFDRRMREKLASECRAQIERHLELVGYLNHIDGHLNFHVHPVLADILVGLAVEYKVPCLRLPREPVLTTLALETDHAARKLVEAVIFRTLSLRLRGKASVRGIKSNDWIFGLHQSGNVDEAYMLGVIERLRDGVTEIYFHPAMDLGGVPPDAAARQEVEVLTSPRVAEALSSRAIALTTFAELAHAQV